MDGNIQPTFGIPLPLALCAVLDAEHAAAHIIVACILHRAVVWDYG